MKANRDPYPIDAAAQIRYGNVIFAHSIECNQSHLFPSGVKSHIHQDLLT